MNDNAGFGSAGVPYEYTVSEQKNAALTFKKISLMTLYVLWVGGLLLLGAQIKLILPLLALIPVTTWMLIFFTWRLTQVEYEYSFFTGELTVCRILGGRSRKVLVKVKLRDLCDVYPCSNTVAAERVEAFAADRTVFAASSPQSATLCSAMWKDESNQKITLFFDCNEKAAKILRYYNASATHLRDLFEKTTR
jgi:hypothetical protein